MGQRKETKTEALKELVTVQKTKNVKGELNFNRQPHLTSPLPLNFNRLGVVYFPMFNIIMNS